MHLDILKEIEEDQTERERKWEKKNKAAKGRTCSGLCFFLSWARSVKVGVWVSCLSWESGSVLGLHANYSAHCVNIMNQEERLSYDVWIELLFVGWAFMLH